MKPSVLILGAHSDIGKAIAHAFAALGHPIQLAARNAGKLKADQSDIALRYNVAVSLHEFDALDLASHAAFVDGLSEMPEVAICVVGLMGEQSQNEQDLEAAIRVMRSNYEGPAHILAELANRFEVRGSGTLVGVSSVAGERGRATNYVYGSAKAGFSAFLSGLRNRLAQKGVHVVTVLPGFVVTKMTEGMDLPAPLTTTPDNVAKAVVDAVERRVNIIYIKRTWRYIMMIIRAIPEGIFKTRKI
ncbi:SDR family oxidoreductase [Sulfitobacter sp. F26169L]|uniref:SDR family oxidoreductase n=1 Tax=Sulfitobacter sp. F26169L TaxID=2996015 RepID=UPI002261001C|nr:SDR family oxidoreductase [Sulfitobacter sp. F26169L]